MAIKTGVDTTLPMALSVNSNALDNTYKVGDLIPITVTFNEAVNVTGTRLTLETGNTDAVVDYAGGSGTIILTFNYTVGRLESSDLDYATTSALSLNGGTINNNVGNVATLTLPDEGYQ